MKKILSIILFGMGSIFYFKIAHIIVEFESQNISEVNSGLLVVMIIYLVFILPLLRAFVQLFQNKLIQKGKL